MKGLLFGNNVDRLAREMQRGNERAAADLYQALVGKVFGFCLNRVGNKALAEDLAQDIFLKLVDNIETFDPKKGSFSAWFWKMARNTLIDYYRRQHEIPFADLEGARAPERIAADDVEYDSGRVEARQLIGDIIKTFTVEEQELFRLRYVVDLSYRDIAKITNKPEGALRVAVSRLSRKLRGKYNAPENHV
ncbi:MAG: hypothetical protein A2939_00910 [Parcubacteria group bacterium RIFCSPLOWO2_01_FULL_48_18]|nr:MAG: hypothetical protein A2939_00910 [Parcubacteria group bacterium RIFCSPLOWO2_01_FULL_48_18]